MRAYRLRGNVSPEEFFGDFFTPSGPPVYQILYATTVLQ